MKNNKSLLRITGYNKETKRQNLDYYITPEYAIKELLKREKFIGNGWEPACGNGAISKFFRNIKSSDIRTDNDIYGEKGIDFLKQTIEVYFIITNPPYNLAYEFMEKSLLLSKNKVALFLRIQFLEGKKRFYFFQKYPPSKIYIFSRRINCDPNNPGFGGVTCFAWFIWEIGNKNKPIIDWIL